MKRIWSIIFLLAAAICAYAQEVPDNELARDIREFPQRAGVNTHAYEFAPIQDTPAPRGYKPFYISHYGRHGSRSGEADEFLRLKSGLEAAKADGQLTREGEWVLEAALKAIDCHAGMDGHLTARGRREHAMIAERMYKRFPAVFKKGSKRIFAASSTVPRCLVSMASFTNRLTSLQRDLEIELETGEQYMAYIARGEGKEIRSLADPVMDSLKRIPDTTSILATIFIEPASARNYVHSAYRLERDIFSLARFTEAFDIEGNFYALLPESVVYYFVERQNLSIYIHQANSKLLGDKRMQRAVPLAQDIISRADEVIAGAPRAADLRFGHDWPLMAIMAYFGLEGASERLSIEEAKGHWIATRYIPFAGNLQLIFYRNKQNDIIVKFLINERETLIPSLTPVQGPYYRWTDVVSMLPADSR